MEPQNNIAPEQFSTQNKPAPAPQTFNPKKSKSTIILSIILVIVLMAGAAGIYLQTAAVKEKEDALVAAQAENDKVKEELEKVKADLAAANAKVTKLDSPAAKANDVQRKADLTRFVAAINGYSANNNGKFPSTEPTAFAQEFEDLYITGKLKDFNDPTTDKPYELVPVAKVQTPPGVTLGMIQYQWPGKCAGSEFEDVDSERQAAARLILESGEIYCLDV